MMQENPNSQFNVFSDNYNKGFYEFANNISSNYFKSTNVDRNVLIGHAEKNIILKQKIEELDRLIKSQDILERKDYYGLVKLAGKIFVDVAGDIMSSGIPEVKKSGLNIINGFFDVARKTKDNELLETAQIIRRNAESAI
jgi:hypothetical protein